MDKGLLSSILRAIEKKAGEAIAPIAYPDPNAPAPLQTRAPFYISDSAGNRVMNPVAQREIKSQEYFRRNLPLAMATTAPVAASRIVPNMASKAVSGFPKSARFMPQEELQALSQFKRGVPLLTKVDQAANVNNLKGLINIYNQMKLNPVYKDYLPAVEMMIRNTRLSSIPATSNLATEGNIEQAALTRNWDLVGRLTKMLPPESEFAKAFNRILQFVGKST